MVLSEGGDGHLCSAEYARLVGLVVLGQNDPREFLI